MRRQIQVGFRGAPIAQSAHGTPGSPLLVSRSIGRRISVTDTARTCSSAEAASVGFREAQVPEKSVHGTPGIAAPACGVQGGACP